MSSPVVSVVVIFLNAESFLNQALQSVAGQTFRDWELILVDDGSTDASASIAQGWCEAEPHRIRLLRHPDGANCGMSASRNLGLRHASGEFVAYLDADDVWEPQALQQRVDEMRRHPSVPMIFGPSLYWSSWSAPTQADRQQQLGLAVGTVHEPPALACHFLLHSEATPQLGTALFRRVQLVDATRRSVPCTKTRYWR
jgi:glycosyltransferase involved in cell wall biosynthesis